MEITKNAIKEVVEIGREMKEAAGRVATGAVADIKDQAHNAIETGRENAEALMRRYPWRAVGITAGVALLAGLALRGVRRFSSNGNAGSRKRKTTATAAAAKKSGAA